MTCEATARPSQAVVVLQHSALLHAADNAPGVGDEQSVLERQIEQVYNTAISSQRVLSGARLYAIFAAGLWARRPRFADGSRSSRLRGTEATTAAVSPGVCGTLSARSLPPQQLCLCCMQQLGDLYCASETGVLRFLSCACHLDLTSVHADSAASSIYCILCLTYIYIFVQTYFRLCNPVGLLKSVCMLYGHCLSHSNYCLQTQLVSTTLIEVMAYRCWPISKPDRHIYTAHLQTHSQH